MNPLTNVKNLQKMNKLELEMGYTGKKGSWHDQYSHSAWIFVGGLPYDLTEGDVITVFSQYGEIANINLARDKKTGNSKGFAFICYENQKSTILAVDNFNGIKLLGRTIRVDHVAEYKPPDVDKIEDDERKDLLLRGCAPEVAIEREKAAAIAAPAPVKEEKREHDLDAVVKVERRDRHERHDDRDHEKRGRGKRHTRSRSSDSSEDERRRRRKREKDEDEKRRKKHKKRDKSRSRSRDRERRHRDDKKHRK